MSETVCYTGKAIEIPSKEAFADMIKYNKL